MEREELQNSSTVLLKMSNVHSKYWKAGIFTKKATVTITHEPQLLTESNKNGRVRVETREETPARTQSEQVLWV